MRTENDSPITDGVEVNISMSECCMKCNRKVVIDLDGVEDWLEASYHILIDTWTCHDAHTTARIEEKSKKGTHIPEYVFECVATYSPSV